MEPTEPHKINKRPKDDTSDDELSDISPNDGQDSESLTHSAEDQNADKSEERSQVEQQNQDNNDHSGSMVEAMRLSDKLKEVKYIDQKTKDLVYGHIRENQQLFQNDNISFKIPTIIIHWVLLYYWIDPELLILISSEEDNPREFEISRKAALMCNLVGFILLADRNAKKIPIKKVRGDILELIVDYLKHHDGKIPPPIAKPIRSVKMIRIVSDPWDADFMNKMNKKTIFQVVLGANYMDIPPLLHLGAAKIATLIKGKSPEEIKNILCDDSNDNKE